MRSLRSSALPALFSLSVMVVSAACGDSPARVTASPDAGAPAEGGDGCTGQGTGTLVLAAKGLPDGVKGKATIAGPGGTQVVDAPGSVSVPAGSYSVSATVATNADPLVRTVFTAAPASSTTCVGDGATVTIELAYAAVPSSGRLWMLAGERVGGFASSKLSATSTQAVESLTAVSNPTALAFEQGGGAWIATGSSLRHYPAGVFGKEGDQLPDVTLDVPAKEEQDVVAIGGIAFDRSGNLWYSACAEGKVRRIASEHLRSSGLVTSYVTLGGLTRPGTIAFDPAGNLWVTDQGDRGINRFSAAGLTTNLDGPDLQIAPHELGGQEPNRLLGPTAIAFDGAGGLWASYGTLLVRLPPADLTNRDPTPLVQIAIGADPLSIETLAFDESGGHWMTYLRATPPPDPAAPTIARFAPEQLTQGSSDLVEPERIIAIDLGGFDVVHQLAFFPAPAGLSLAATAP